MWVNHVKSEHLGLWDGARSRTSGFSSSSSSDTSSSSSRVGGKSDMWQSTHEVVHRAAVNARLRAPTAKTIQITKILQIFLNLQKCFLTYIFLVPSTPLIYVAHSCVYNLASMRCRNAVSVGAHPKPRASRSAAAVSSSLVTHDTTFPGFIMFRGSNAFLIRRCIAR